MKGSFIPGKLNLKGRSSILTGCDADLPIVGGDDFMRDGKAQTHAVFLGRVEWVENPVHHPGRDSRATVLDPDARHVFSALFTGNLNAALSGNRFYGVANDIEEGLLHLVSIHQNPGDLAVAAFFNPDAFGPCFTLDEEDNPIQQIHQPLWAKVQSIASREVQEVLNDGVETPDFVSNNGRDLLELFLPFGFSRAELSLQGLHGHTDGVQGVADLVSYPGTELPKG